MSLNFGNASNKSVLFNLYSLLVKGLFPILFDCLCPIVAHKLTLLSFLTKIKQIDWWGESNSDSAQFFKVFETIV